MFVLALDTTTRRGSVAVVRDGEIVDVYEGDPAIAHGQRLPGDLIRVLERQQLSVHDVDLFAVAAGPGSFTGLRIGIAAMQGFALASGKSLIGVSTLDALNHAFSSELPAPSSELPAFSSIATWIDAQRHEVFAALYAENVAVEEPVADTPDAVLRRWNARDRSQPILFVGDGASIYADLIHAACPEAIVNAGVLPLAPSIAVLAYAQAARQAVTPPDAIRPLYVRRPDVELVRDRKVAR